MKMSLFSSFFWLMFIPSDEPLFFLIKKLFFIKMKELNKSNRLVENPFFKKGIECFRPIEIYNFCAIGLVGFISKPRPCKKKNEKRTKKKKPWKKI